MTDSALPRHRPQGRPPLAKALRSLVGALIGIGAIAGIEQFVLNDTDLVMIIGAFGATAVLVYGAPTSPVFAGHVISALIGVAVFMAVGEANWLSASLAVAVAIFAMQMTHSLHPPGGASALIAITASPQIHALGFLYVVYPVGLGALTLLSVALVVNNIRTDRAWPEFWY